MGTFSDRVEVTTTAAGLPLRLCWQERSYTLAAEPLRWYERRNWWSEETRAALGRGPGLVDRQMWRIQARNDATGELRTFDLVRYLPGSHWRLIKVHDAVVEERAHGEEVDGSGGAWWSSDDGIVDDGADPDGVDPDDADPDAADPEGADPDGVDGADPDAAYPAARDRHYGQG